MQFQQIRFITALLLAFTLAGCSGEQCIEADDFGHAHFTVSARYSAEEMGEQVGENQIAPWINSNYRVNGRPLTMVVRGWQPGLDRNVSWELSAWCAWYGTSKDGGLLPQICKRLRDCRYIDDQMCTNTRDAQIINAPCLFRNGVGLYALVAEKDSDPNLTYATMRQPKGISFHMGEKQDDYLLYEFDKNNQMRRIGGRVYQFSEPDKLKYADSELYFKILDKFYDDNSGQYKIVIKSGISRMDPDPISYVTRLVKEFLFGSNGDDYGIIRSMYMNIIQNTGYQLAVSALLSLYIAYTALAYLAGSIQLTNTELIVRVSKVAIISALLKAETSWDFFNNYLFVYFIGGVEQILQMITEAGATGPGSPGILALMMAPQTLSKVVSLLFADWLGFIYIILFLIALYFILMVFFKASVIYLSALIAIGMIIIMGPIFICFMLFGATRSLFENWLKQLISYAVQPIILFTGLVFISMILRQEIYNSLGFRVCKYSFPPMPREEVASFFGDATQEKLGQNFGNSIFYWWFPQPMKGEKFSQVKQTIPIPIDHYSNIDGVVGAVSDDGFCEAYACLGERYPDLPFLDPDKDSRRLNQFWNGVFVQLDGLFLIFVAIYLLHKFNGLAVSVARFLTNSSGNFTNLQNIGNNIGSQTFGKANSYLAKLPGRGARAALDRTIGKERRQAIGQAIKNAPSTLVDKWRVKNLRQEAFSKKANSSVLDEVKLNTGLDRNNIDQQAPQKYQQALAAQLLKNIDDKLPAAQRQNIASQAAAKLANKPLDALGDEFAKIKYGKNFQELRPQEQASIKSILADSNLRRLSTEASKYRTFQQAYIDAFAGMSERGIGVLGKRNKGLRSLQELNHAAKEKQKSQTIKRQQFGQELVSEIQGVKAKAFGDKANRSDAWHGIDVSEKAKNYRRTTYAEQLADQRKYTKNQELRDNIRDYSKKYRENITTPEFLAKATLRKDSNLEAFRKLAKQDIDSKVYDHLTRGEKPILMGDTYMSQYATDSELRIMIDRLQQAKNTIISSDEFISRNEAYEINHDLASRDLEEVKQKLEAHYERSIDNQELLKLSHDYYEQAQNQQQPEAKETDQAEPEKAEKEFAKPEDALAQLNKVKNAMAEIEKNKNMIAEINWRKQNISAAVDQQIEHVNKQRSKAGMSLYKPK